MADFTTIVSLFTGITVIGTAWLTLRKIAKDAAKSRKEHTAEILHAAKEADAVMRSELESKIDSLQQEITNLEQNVDKDIIHLKETYNGELRFLGQKIEELREEVRGHHGQLVQLLTEMIKKRN